MLTSIRQSLAAPVFEDEAQTRQAYLLNTLSLLILLILFAGALLSPAISQVTGNDLTYAEVFPVFFQRAGLLALLSLATFGLIRRGYIQPASTIFVFSAWVIVTINVYRSGGVESLAYLNYLLPTILAGLLLTTRAAGFYAALSFFTGGFILYLDNQNQLPAHVPLNPIGALIFGGASFAIAALIISLYVHRLTEALLLFRRANQQLEEASKTLEKRVADRTRALTSSAEVSRRLSTILDPDQLMLEVVEQIKTTYDYYHGQIYLLDNNKQTLILAGATGEVGRTLLQQGHRIPLERGLVGRAARTQTGILAPDTAQEPDWLPNPLLPETKAEVVVPILLGSELLGVLDMQANRVGAVSDEDLSLIQAIANQVAIALQNARQYEETQLLFRASQALATASTYQEILDAFMTFAAPHAEQGGLLVFEANDEGHLIAVDYVAAWSRQKDQPQAIQVGARFAPEQIPFTQLFASDQPLIIADIAPTTPGPQTASPEIAAILTQFGVQAMAGYPLMLGGQLLGALLFGYTQPHLFIERELQPVQVIASQIAVLLRNQQLLAESQATLTRLDIVNRRLIGEGWREFSKLSGGLLVEDRVPGLSSDALETALQDSKNGQGDFNKEITVPITVRGQEIGQFRLQHLDPQAAFQDNDLEMLQSVADEVAAALENIRLLEETQYNAQALEESRNLLDAVIENLPLLLFVKDAKELRYIRWNKAGEEMLGISAAETLGKNAYDSFPKEEADRFTAQDWESLSGETLLDISEETVETPRGTRILHTRKTPVFSADGQARYLVGLSEDITERKQAEQALKDLETLYRRAIAAADAVPYSRRYTDETFTFIGDKIEDLTGYTPDEFTAALLDSLILETVIYSVKDLPQADAVRLTRTSKMPQWKADYRIRTREGRERWLADTSVEMVGPDGTSTGSVGILTDITDRKHAEETLNRQLREMEILNTIGQIIVAQQDLDSLLVLIGEKICEAFNVDTGYIALYDSRAELLQVPFYLDFGERLSVEPQPVGVGLAARVMETRQPLLIPAMTPELSAQLGAHQVGRTLPASWLGVPILSGHEVLGVVSVQNPTQTHWFSENDTQLLTTITANLSTAIQNIRLQAQTQNTLSELEQLTRRLTRESWQSYFAHPPEELGYSYDLTHVEPITTDLPANGTDLMEHPIVVQGETVGRLVVAETSAMDEETFDLLTAVSHQLSAHIENLRLLEETERGRHELDKRAAELTTVAEVATVTSTLLNPDELLQTVVNLTKSSFGLYHAHIYLLDQSGETLLLSNGAGEVGFQMVMQGWHIPFSAEKSPVIRAAKTRTGIIVNDVQAAPDYLPNPLLPNTRSELAVPLLVADRLLGVLDVQSENLNYFTEEDIRIYSTLASQIAVALQNARLYVEQAATVQRLRELDHLKSSFLANMSHELRTPLNSIIGFTEIILEGIDGPLTEFMDGDLKIIRKNGKHLLSLINDVLDMAKIEAGRMSLTYERFLLHELLEDVIDITTSLAHDKQLYLRIESEGTEEAELFADRIRLRQVLINLVGNAIKFTETGGVTLRSEQKDGKLWLKVIDTGIGIPPENLETVFEYFSQVDTSTTRKIGGTGLGLPISRRLVELHNGHLWAESNGIDGKGSTFILALPAEQVPTPQP